MRDCGMESNEGYLSGEWQQMVLAQATELNILNNDHFIVSLVEERTVDNTLDTGLAALAQIQQLLHVP